MAACQQEARKRHDQFERSAPHWARKFRILEAKAILWQGHYDDARRLAQSEQLRSDPADLTVPILTIVGVADIRTRDLPSAARALNDAAKLCHSPDPDLSCGELLQAQGLLASERSDSTSAETYYQASLSFARAHGDPFLEAESLLNLGAESLAQGRFDEALDRSGAAYNAADAIGARFAKLTSKSNIGWAYYRLGDSEQALQLFLDAEKTARELEFVYDQGNELTNIGYIYMDRRQFDLAANSFLQALALAEGIKAMQDVYNADRVLARLSLQTGQLDKATLYAERALQIARDTANHVDELYPRLVQGQIAQRLGHGAEAERIFLEVEQDKSCPVFLKWEAQHSLAGLYEKSNQMDASDREYRLALATFEAARSDVRHEDFHLSFLTNGWRIYDDYVHFLVARGNAADALRWADHSRARTLSNGLGISTKDAAGGPLPLNAMAIARLRRGTVLFYWLGEKQSYLWTITAQKTSVFPLPAASEIDTAVQRFRDALGGPQDVAEYGDNDGRWLFQTLVGPARSLLPKDATIFVVPDGSLNNLNFETLLVAEPKLHYWIEDATVANASSLRMLGASYREDRTPRKLLLFGDNIPPNDRYPALLRAAAQMETVAAHFPASSRQIFSREAATPAAYLQSHPERFSNLHFVAHGTASRLSPLDSAIILSRSSAGHESFKLYARDIIQRPLSADLVTISSCYGTGERAYKGEGLVGLSWAFLRAGAHNVVAALWEAADASTEKLMARFYEELDRGASPANALRTAKISLLQSHDFQSPFYWAPFQLYVQGQPGKLQPAAKMQASSR